MLYRGFGFDCIGFDLVIGDGFQLALFELGFW